MDLRTEVVGVLVGGSPAPGINAAISSVVIEAIHREAEVVGFPCGFRFLKEGLTVTRPLGLDDVTRVHRAGGSILRTSKQQLTTDVEVDNCLRVMQHVRVRYLVTIGGNETAYCAHLLEQAARAAGYPLGIVHVPKTVFNDLPLPFGGKTFGHTSAIEYGARILTALAVDASTLGRYYVVTLIGSKAGHLALGVGKAAATTLTLIPELFGDEAGVEATFDNYVKTIDAMIVKRRAKGKNHGTIALAEGLVDLLSAEEIKSRWGTIEQGHQRISADIVKELQARWATREGYPQTFLSRNIGQELRATDPSALDMDLARNLGYGAVKTLYSGQSGHMVVLHDDRLSSIELAGLVDHAKRRTAIRRVDTTSLSFEVARRYMLHLRKDDLLNEKLFFDMHMACGMSGDEFRAEFEGIATED